MFRLVPSRAPLALTRGAALIAPGAVTTTFTPNTPRNHDLSVAVSRRRLPARPGLLARKAGSITWFTETGLSFPCTVLEVDCVEVTGVRTSEKSGFASVQLGYGARGAAATKRAQLGHFAKAEVNPKKVTREFLVASDAGVLALGQELRADHFNVGSFVDLTANSKGKGFAGVMKRWGFHGQPATHGNSKAHRQMGSTGMNQDPGRTLPGKKMPGRMGGKLATVLNGEVIHVDADQGYLLVKGGCPGPVGGYVKIRDAIKKYTQG